MKITRRAYRGDRDFIRIRRFLIDTFALYGRPYNWLIDRWNFCRYHVLPIHTFYNVQYFGVPVGTAPPHRDELPFWERTIALWEDSAGEIVGVVHSENEEPGEAWTQIHPDYTFLYDDMVSYVEEALTSWFDDRGYVKLHVEEGSELEGVARAHGYRKLSGQRTPHLEYTFGDLPAPELPAGFQIRSVADEDDVERRRRAKGLAFGGYYSPIDWPPAAAFREMQRAPDYRRDLDVFVVAPRASTPPSAPSGWTKRMSTVSSNRSGPTSSIESWAWLDPCCGRRSAAWRTAGSVARIWTRIWNSTAGSVSNRWAPATARGSSIWRNRRPGPRQRLLSPTIGHGRSEVDGRCKGRRKPTGALFLASLGKILRRCNRRASSCAPTRKLSWPLEVAAVLRTEIPRRWRSY